MEYKTSLSNKMKLLVLSNKGDFEGFRKRCNLYGVMISDYEYEIKENKYNSPIMSEKEGMHRESTFLIDGVLATVQVLNGECVAVGTKLVKGINKDFVEQVLADPLKKPKNLTI